MMARPGRTAAVVGAVVAFAAVTLMGMLAGSASAATPGTCLENVNVRAEPTSDARIVALCEAGTAVTTGTVRNGFVRIDNLGGWAAEQYIDVEDAPSGTSRTAPSSDDRATSPSSTPSTSTPSTTAPRSGGGSTGDDDTARSGDDARNSGSTATSTPDEDEDADEDSGVGGGLLG